MSVSSDTRTMLEQDFFDARRAEEQEGRCVRPDNLTQSTPDHSPTGAPPERKP